MVKTTSGNIKGQGSQKPEVSQYLGIPYAKPPVGPLRFAAPQRYSGSGDVDGTKWGNDFPSSARTAMVNNLRKAGLTQAAIINEGVMQVGYNRSEDCLYLNVWDEAADWREIKGCFVMDLWRRLVYSLEQQQNTDTKSTKLS
jgi:cholinesterase